MTTSNIGLPYRRLGIVLVAVVLGRAYIGWIDGSPWNVRAYDSTAWWIVLSLAAIFVAGLVAFRARDSLPGPITILVAGGVGGLVTFAASSLPGVIIGLLIGTLVVFDATRQAVVRLTRSLAATVLPAAASGIIAGLVASITYFHFDGNLRWLAVLGPALLLLVSFAAWRNLSRRATLSSYRQHGLSSSVLFCTSALICLTVGFQLDTVRRYLAIQDDRVRVRFTHVAFGPRIFIRGLWDVEAIAFIRGSTDDDIARVRGFPFAKHCGVYPESNVSDRGLRRLGLTRLQTFYLRHDSITDEGIRFLDRCPELTYLDLQCAKITDDGLVVLKGKRNLTELRLENTAVSGNSLRHLDAACPLVHIDLSWSQTNDRALSHLSPMGVTHIQLRGTLIKGDGLKHLTKCPWLSVLDLSNTRLREQYLADLAGCAALETLALDGIRLTIRGTESISQIPALRQLRITHTGVDDASLAPLRNIPNLKYLRVDADQLTTAGYAFISHVPTISLEYDGDEMTLADIAKRHQSLATVTRARKVDDLGFAIWNLPISEQVLPILFDLEARYNLVLRSPRIRGKAFAPDADVTVAETERAFRNGNRQR